jgi:RNA polymerase sigma-70 factor (ECF subfamily)
MGLPRSQPPAQSREVETEWILRCQSGDAAAFRALVEQYQERGFWVAYHMVGQVEDAQDIVQEAFIRVYRALPRFRVGRRFYTWFYQIVLHLAIDSLRKRREHSSLPAESAEGMASGLLEPPEELSRNERVAEVQEVLTRLSPRERAILVLRDIEGFSAKEIAEIIHSNHATVRWWLFLARKGFRREWERRNGKEEP